MARQAAAVEGSRFGHRGGRDSSQRGMPQECIQQIAGYDSVGGPTGETAVLLNHHNTAGAATGSFCGFQNLSDENLKTNLNPVRRPAHEGGVQRRIELVKKRRSGDPDCHCVTRVSHVSKKEDDTEREAVMNRASEHNLVSLLDKWSTRWKRLHSRLLWTRWRFGIPGASEMKQACIAVNHFLRALSDSNMDFHCRAVQSVNAAVETS